jgi:hypothetical protein
MTEQERKYYDKLKIDKTINDYVYDKLFNNDGKPKEGIWFRFMGDGIPYIFQTTKSRITLENIVTEIQPSEKIKSTDIFEEFEEGYWKNSPFGENSIFHPSYDQKEKIKKEQKEEKLKAEKITSTNKANINCTCNVHSKAKNFNELVELVKEAEIILIKNKITDIEDRINCIRGIYYGAEWSLDFVQEKSKGRNAGFRVYTTFAIENDARTMLKCSDNCKNKLFEALFQTPEVIDSSSRVTDFGHLMIGLDARRSYIARFTNLPYGGTGLENVTWVGDIGGGAGMLAYKRALDPTVRAKKLVFDSAHDYGCSINIEGDIAAYVVGIDKKEIDEISDSTDNMEFIHEGLKKFFDKNDWTARINYFIGMLGGKIEKGRLTNRDEVLDRMIDSVEGMAQVYITLRVNDKSMDKKALLKSFGYMNSCAKEVSEIFLDGLIDLRTHPNTNKFVAVTDPKPTIVENSTIDEGIKKAEIIISKISKILKL